MEGWIVTFHQELLSTTTIICEDESTNNTLLMYCFSKMKECSKFAVMKLLPGI